MGTMLLNNDCIDEVARQLTPQDFLEGVHAKLFDHICGLWGSQDRPPSLTARTVAFHPWAWESEEEHTRVKLLANQCEQDARPDLCPPVQDLIDAIKHARSSEQIWWAVTRLNKYQTHTPSDRQTIDSLAKSVRDVCEHGLNRPMFSGLIKYMDNPPTYQIEVSMMRKRVVMKLTHKQIVDLPALESMIYAYFDAFPDRMPGKKQWRLILNRLGETVEKKALDGDRPNELVSVQQSELEERVLEYINGAKRTKSLEEIVPGIMWEQPENAVEALSFTHVAGYVRQKVTKVKDGAISEILMQLGFQMKRVAGKKRLWIRAMETLV
jgi:hypothetical protein